MSRYRVRMPIVGWAEVVVEIEDLDGEEPTGQDVVDAFFDQASGDIEDAVEYEYEYSPTATPMLARAEWEDA